MAVLYAAQVRGVHASAMREILLREALRFTLLPHISGHNGPQFHFPKRKKRDTSGHRL